MNETVPVTPQEIVSSIAPVLSAIAGFAGNFAANPSVSPLQYVGPNDLDYLVAGIVEHIFNFGVYSISGFAIGYVFDRLRRARIRNNMVNAIIGGVISGIGFTALSALNNFSPSAYIYSFLNQ